MRRNGFFGLMILLFSFGAQAQIPQNVSMEEVMDICSYATTETQGAQCFPMAWSALNSADFIITAVTTDAEVNGQELQYHVSTLAAVSRGLLEILIALEAQEAGLPISEYIATDDFLAFTLDTIMETDAELFSEARMFLFAVSWEARLALYDIQGETPEDVAELREVAETRVQEIIDEIFDGNLASAAPPAFTTENEDVGQQEEGQEQNEDGSGQP